MVGGGHPWHVLGGDQNMVTPQALGGLVLFFITWGHFVSFGLNFPVEKKSHLSYSR